MREANNTVVSTLEVDLADIKKIPKKERLEWFWLNLQDYLQAPKIDVTRVTVSKKLARLLQPTDKAGQWQWLAYGPVERTDSELGDDIIQILEHATNDV